MIPHRYTTRTTSSFSCRRLRARKQWRSPPRAMPTPHLRRSMPNLRLSQRHFDRSSRSRRRVSRTSTNPVMIARRVLSMVFLRVRVRHAVCCLPSLASRLAGHISCLSLHRIHTGRSGYQGFDFIGVDIVDERWYADEFHVDADEQSYPTDPGQSTQRMVD